MPATQLLAPAANAGGLPAPRGEWVGLWRSGGLRRLSYGETGLCDTSHCEKALTLGLIEKSPCPTSCTCLFGKSWSSAGRRAGRAERWGVERCSGDATTAKPLACLLHVGEQAGRQGNSKGPDSRRTGGHAGNTTRTPACLTHPCCWQSAQSQVPAQWACGGTFRSMSAPAHAPPGGPACPHCCCCCCLHR